MGEIQKSAENISNTTGVGAAGRFLGDVGDSVGLGDPNQLSDTGAFALTNQARKGEKEVLKDLRAQASGNAPSIAEMQLQQAQDDVMRQQMSAANSMRGASNPMLLQREALQLGSQAGVELGQSAAIAKLAEQRNAQQAILNQASSQRGGAIQAAGANLAAQSQNQANKANFLGNIGASAMAMSDEEQKEDIKPSKDDASKMIEEFMEAMKSYTYEYKKGKGNPKGEHTSVMAQDLEKSDLGKQMVKDTPKGKMVDYAQGMAPLFAAIAELNEKVNKLQK
jgi:hypothetical protein